MSVIVHDEMPVELALRLLWREATREGIIESIKNNRYYVKHSTKRHNRVKRFTKAKKRKRSIAKRRQTKGY